MKIPSFHTLSWVAGGPFKAKLGPHLEEHLTSMPPPEKGVPMACLLYEGAPLVGLGSNRATGAPQLGL